MTKEERRLLLLDISARLPYNVVIRCTDNDTDYKCFLTTDILNEILLNIEYYEYRPYLRPMSNMTEEENDELYTNIEWCADIDENGNFIIDKYTGSKIYRSTITGYVSWLLAHHFDFNNLIEKGLALEAPNDMYKTE